MASRFSGGDQPNDLVGFAIAVADDENSAHDTHSEEYESILILRVIWIADEERCLVVEDRGGLLERDPVLGLVGIGLLLIPLEAQVAHTHSIRTM